MTGKGTARESDGKTFLRIKYRENYNTMGPKRYKYIYNVHIHMHTERGKYVKNKFWINFPINSGIYTTSIMKHVLCFFEGERIP